MIGPWVFFSQNVTLLGCVSYIAWALSHCRDNRDPLVKGAQFARTRLIESGRYDSSCNISRKSMQDSGPKKPILKAFEKAHVAAFRWEIP